MTLALDSSPQRQDQQDETRLEVELSTVEVEPTEQVDLAALASAQAQAEFELTLGQILNAATGGQGPSDEWLLARKQAMLGAKEPSRRLPQASRTAPADR